MNNKTIAGDLQYKEKRFPFVMIGRAVTIIDSYGKYFEDFENAEEEDVIWGWANNGMPIAFLACRFNKINSPSNTIKFTIQGYIELSLEIEVYPIKFDLISFTSKAIDTFYSPNHYVEYTVPRTFDKAERTNFILGAKTKQPSESEVCFEFENFSFRLSFNKMLNFQNKSILEVTPELQIITETPQDTTKALEWVVKIYDILCFLNFRKDIYFDEIKLYKSKGDLYSNIGKLHIFTSIAPDTFDSTAFDSIIYEDIPHNNYAKLFMVVSNWRNDVTYNQYFFPKDKSDSKLLDNAKWLTTAISFDSMFDKKHKTFKSDKNSSFAIAKTEVLKLIDELISKNPDNKYYEKLRVPIEKEGILEEQFNHYIKVNNVELCDTINRLKNKFNIDDTNYGNIYSKKRNLVAHGTIQPITDKDCFTYNLIRAMLYVYFLKEAEVPTENIKQILKKLFR
ncbi:MAG: hypothetical protein IJN86_01280 [Clostridia bacterium]|nr:hypothetical protein [Clostridia bacterium]